MGLVGFQAVATVVMVILAVVGLIGFYKYKDEKK